MLYCKNEKCKEYRTGIPHNCLNWESNLSRDCGFINATKSDATVVSSDEALKKLINAAENIHHWHCWGKDNEGMVVSSEAVHNLWKVLIEIKRAEVVQNGDKCIEIIKEEIKKRKRKPTHGSCCTCQECGQHYDDCECNTIMALNSILSRFED